MRKMFILFRGTLGKHYTELSLGLESYPVLEAALIDTKKKKKKPLIFNKQH